MGKKLTTKMVAEQIGIPQKDVLKRIRMGDIVASKFGWLWVVDESELPSIQDSDWFKRLSQRLAS